MSFFYLTPVKGEIPVHLLETIVISRLEYLKALIKSQPFDYNEYVVEGSVYDVVGHYTLCVMAVLEDSTEFKEFLIKAEDILFRNRLKTMAAYDLRCFAKKLLRIIRKHCTDLPYLVPLRSLCQHLMLRDLSHHICSVCYDKCSLHCFKVNFKHCTEFLANRQIVLSNGVARIPCSKWKSYLIQLFNKNLRNKLYKTELDSLKTDPRLIDLFCKIEKEIGSMYGKSNIVLKSGDVDCTCNLFPPCMRNLHQHLRQKHRLTHNQRFLYSLFLKDLGMPVEEAIVFWRKEYQQVPSGKAGCCHNWKEDEKKFVYGIRHMYGLEGGRRKYSCRSCQQIQGSDTSYSEGGCPFKSFDDDKMNYILNIEKTDPLLSQIKEYKTNGQFTSACMLYLQNILKQNDINCNINFNFTPVKYYLVVSSCMKL